MKKEEHKPRIVAFNSLTLERENIKTSDDGKRTYIKGYACHFYTPNHNQEVVIEDSFREFFAELENGGQMPIFNYQHSWDIIGGWDKITSDDKGLIVEGHLVNDVALVRDTILPLLNDGVLNSLSTEGWSDWKSNEDVYDENGNWSHYIAHKFTLTGISLVGLPADFNATIDVQNALLLQRQQRKPLAVEPTKVDNTIETKEKKSIINPYLFNF